MGIIRELTSLQKKITYAENRLEQYRLKEAQGFELTQEDVEDRIRFHNELDILKNKWDKINFDKSQGADDEQRGL